MQSHFPTQQNFKCDSIPQVLQENKELFVCILHVEVFIEI